jgi:hypothetical protein
VREHSDIQFIPGIGGPNVHGLANSCFIFFGRTGLLDHCADAWLGGIFPAASTDDVRAWRHHITFAPSVPYPFCWALCIFA